jgi:hypothetical protein
LRGGRSFVATVALAGGRAKLNAKRILNAFREGCSFFRGMLLKSASAFMNAFNKK